MSKELLGLVLGPEQVCCRYRIAAFQSQINENGWTTTLSGIPKGMFSRLREARRASDFESIVLQRKLLDPIVFRSLRKNSRRLVFDFDDAVWAKDSYAAKQSPRKRDVSAFRRTVAAADVVVAGNQFLAERAGRWAEPERIHVVPTCVDMTRYPIRNRESSDRQSDAVTLVWIGSSSTLQGIEQLKPVLETTGSQLKNLSIKLICDRFIEFENLQVQGVPWSAETEVAELQSSDIGISWIPDDDWSRGKCGLKTLQYMAAGLPVVTNPVGVHSEMVEHGRSGFLATSPQEWSEAIYTLAEDADLRRSFGERGREIVAERYSVSAWSEKVSRLLTCA